MDSGASAPKTSASKSHARPRSKQQTSASVPSTPRQEAQDYGERTPSPGTATGSHSPLSISSDPSHHHSTSMKSNSSTLPTCRYQSTKTARRRVPYDSSDPLPSAHDVPKAKLSSHEDKKLDEEICTLFRESLPSGESQHRREDEATKLRKILRQEFQGKDLQVSVFGSSGNLLNTESSDVDICVTMKDLTYVCTLAEILARHGMKNVTCVHAKGVPIVKIWDPELGMSCDLNVNNNLALVNTRLVKAYMEIDERARILAMAIKFWSKRRVLNEASGGGLSSYTWTLLVINFLQTRTPPILPVIGLKDSTGKEKTDFREDTDCQRDFGSANKSSAGALVFHFFRYLAHEIDYETAVVSVRTGRLMTKLEKHWENLISQRLCCEEPFNTQRNLGNTADEFSFHGIHLELRKAFDHLAKGDSFRKDVCDQFVFPTHEPKLFERPPPQPKPVLTRSASQSGRGGRFGGSRGRQRNENRGGNANRRASSASVWAQETQQPQAHHQHHQQPQPFLIAPHMLGAPNFLPQGFQFPPNMSVERQQQQISAEIDVLMRREQQLAWYNQNFSRLSALDLDRAPSSGSHSPSQRLTNDARQDKGSSTAHTAFPSPAFSNMSQSTTFEMSPPMSHSTSHQGTNTSPSSPALSHAAPLRRTSSRNTTANSPGASHRSQSQPARSYLPVNAGVYGALAPGYYVMPNGSFAIRPGQPLVPMMYRPASMYLPYTYGQVLPTGQFIPFGYEQDASTTTATPTSSMPSPSRTNASAASEPREYVGYALSNRAPSLSPSPMDQEIQPIPTFEDLHRSGRDTKAATASVGRDASKETVIREKTIPPSAISASSLPVTQTDPPQTTPRNTTAVTPKSSNTTVESRGPMIVNGSFSTPNLYSLQGKRMSEALESSRRLNGISHNGWANPGENALNAQPPAAKSAVKSTGKGQDASSSPSLSSSPVFANELRKTSTGLGLSMGGVAHSTQRLSMPNLDLGAPAEKVREGSLAAATLSPVREQPSPSPISPTNVALPGPILVSGSPAVRPHHGKKNDLSGSPKPEEASITHRLNEVLRPSSTQKFTGASPPTNKTFVPSPPTLAQANEWQQAGKKSSRRKSGVPQKPGGQAMPENISERKGG